ncbi:MAG TPA: hypothetical protein VG900_11120 [Hyphomicrobiaceae bacterium]|jgi:hypothetical protein|nr:hypothetical protein [Hyphomicrobiaceae bacterium]
MHSGKAPVARRLVLTMLATALVGLPLAARAADAGGGNGGGSEGKGGDAGGGPGRIKTEKSGK